LAKIAPEIAPYACLLERPIALAAIGPLANAPPHVGVVQAQQLVRG